MNYPYTKWSNLFQLLKYVVNPGILPPELDLAFYRSIHPDMHSWDDKDLQRHYSAHGIREGRIGSPAAHKIGLINTIKENSNILEIGPFTKPLCYGVNVKYFDVLDRQALEKRAIQENFPIERPVDIDFVSANGDLSIIPSDKFDYIVSSHCIEHQPDLITHLKHIERILKKDGMYYLVIPDKRFCFDHFIPESCMDEIIRAFSEKRTIHTIKSVYEHWVLRTHSEPIKHWLGDHDDPNYSARLEKANKTIELHHASSGSYIDVHAWQFTPDQFRKILLQLKNQGLINLNIERVYNTIWGSYEFTAVLSLI